MPILKICMNFKFLLFFSVYFSRLKFNMIVHKYWHLCWINSKLDFHAENASSETVCLHCSTGTSPL